MVPGVGGSLAGRAVAVRVELFGQEPVGLVVGVPDLFVDRAVVSFVNGFLQAVAGRIGEVFSREVKRVVVAVVPLAGQTAQFVL